MKTLWLVGQFIAETEHGNVWAFQGIFETRELAVAACRDRNYSVQSVRLNEEIQHGTQYFPDCEYPKA